MPAAGAIRAGRAFVELFADDSRLVRGLRSAQRKLKAFATSVNRIGRQLLTMGTLAAVPFALSAQTFAKFEQQMARVKALTNSSAEDFSRLEQEAKRLGATTVFSASQAAEAMSYFALAGYNVEQILSAIGPTLDLAAAGQIEIAEAADIAAKIMAGMGLSADQLGNAVDVMAKAMTTANTDLLMLGEAFKFVGPMAKSAGIPLEEITAAIQLLSNAGVQGEMAGTTLRGMLLSLTAPSAEADRELKRLGVRVVDEAGNVRSLADIIADLEGALSGVGSGEKLRVLGTIFPARQAAGAAELVAQGAERLREATAALGDASGTASRIAGTQLDTLQGDFVILLSALEGVAIAVGEAFGTELRAALRGVSSFLGALGTWVGENKRVVLTAVGIVAAMLGVGAALVGLGTTLQLVAFSLGGLATGLSVAATVMGAILSPIGLVTAAIVGLSAYLIYASGAGGAALEWLGRKFHALKEMASAALGGISDALAAGDLGLAARILWLSLKLEWQEGVHALNSVWLEVKDAFLATWTEAVYGAASIATNGWAALESGWIETVDVLADAWTLFTTGLIRTWNTAVGFIRKAWVRLKSLFDSDIDVDAEVERINADVDQQSAAAGAARDQQLLQREQRRRDRLAGIEAQRGGALGELDTMRESEHLQNRRAVDADLASSEAALDAARREWQAALDEAATKKAATETGGEEPASPGVPPDLVDTLQQQLSAVGRVNPSIDFGLSEAQKQAIKLQSLGAGRQAPEEQTAKNTQQMIGELKAQNRTLRDLLAQQKRGGNSRVATIG